MNVYEINDLGALLKDNTYPGRGIVVGKSKNGRFAAVAYFIMGRSENSRNRVFSVKNGDIVTEPFDYSKVEDPSLIIYSAIRKIADKLIVTNGDQTDTIYDFLKKGEDMRAALRTRDFEPDSPNFTPRISATLNFENSDFSYEMSILKSADSVGSASNRYFYEYSALCGVGHFIHTYVTDGNPIPTFQGEPERVAIGNCAEEFTKNIWENLNADNKISLYTNWIDLTTGEEKVTIINKHQ